MASQRQIPGGAYYNEQGTTRRAQIPGAQYVNEVAAAGGGPQTISLPQATETDTAQALGKAKAKAVGQASETNSANTFTVLSTTTVALAQAAETDTAQAFAKSKSKAIGQVTETDTAQPFSTADSQVVAFGQATETDAAQAFDSAKVKALGQATETQASQPVTAVKTVAFGQATETDTAQAYASAKAKALGQATETSTAQPLTFFGPRKIALGQAVETDTAQSIITPSTSVTGGTPHQRIRWRRSAEHVIVAQSVNQLVGRPEFLTFSTDGNGEIHGHSLFASKVAIARLEAEAVAWIRPSRPLKMVAHVQARAETAASVTVRTRPNRLVTGHIEAVGVQNPSDWEFMRLGLELVQRRRAQRRRRRNV